MPRLMNNFFVATLCQEPDQNLGSSTEVTLVIE